MLTKEQKAAKRAIEAQNTEIERAYYRHGNGVQINIMDITNIYKDCRTALAAGTVLDDAMKTAVAKYRQN
jgi:hypothetical protein